MQTMSYFPALTRLFLNAIMLQQILKNEEKNVFEPQKWQDFNFIFGSFLIVCMKTPHRKEVRCNHVHAA